MNCPECGANSVLKGMLAGYCGVTFVEEGTENKLRPNAYRVRCRACTGCGHIFDMRIISTGKHKVGSSDCEG